MEEFLVWTILLRGDRVSVIGNSLYTSARYARRWGGDDKVAR
jgi:hypothetical protein